MKDTGTLKTLQPGDMFCLHLYPGFAYFRFAYPLRQRGQVIALVSHRLEEQPLDWERLCTLHDRGYFAVDLRYFVREGSFEKIGFCEDYEPSTSGCREPEVGGWTLVSSDGQSRTRVTSLSPDELRMPIYRGISADYLRHLVRTGYDPTKDRRDSLQLAQTASEDYKSYIAQSASRTKTTPHRPPHALFFITSPSEELTHVKTMLARNRCTIDQQKQLDGVVDLIAMKSIPNDQAESSWASEFEQQLQSDLRPLGATVTGYEIAPGTF